MPVERQALKAAIANPFKSGNWIGGEERWAKDGAMIERSYPAGSGIISKVAKASPDDAKDAISIANRTFEQRDWADLYGGEKAKVISAVADCIRRDADELTLLETLETGKTLAASRADVLGAADLWDYAAGLARTIHGDAQSNLGPSMLGVILREPIGVVSIITPWNFPLLIASERIPFALAAGCSLVVKPSEFTPSTTLRLGRYLSECGLPNGVCNIVAGSGASIGPVLLDHPDVRMISFTGSPRVGEIVISSSARTKKKLSLELGGKSPTIVFDDCDIDAAIDGVLKASHINSGQCCIAGSRLIIQDTVADEFLRRLATRSKDIKVGDPFDPSTTIGSIVNEAQFDQIQKYVTQSAEAGGKIVIGGKGDKADGFFFEPTIIDHVSPNSTLAQEEVFGPVLAIFRFKEMDEAIKIANSTNFGLAAYIWTENLNRALTCARRIEAGRTWINSALQGFAEMPLGGFRQSGVGRETGRIGIEEYCETKAIHIHHRRQTERWVTGN